MDSKRRATLPTALLAMVGIPADHRDLIARPAGQGRIILEDPAATMSDPLQRIAVGKRAVVVTESFENSLAADRANDASLR